MTAIATPIISLAEAKAQLNITDDVSNTKLTAFIAAVSQMIVNKIGPVAGSPTVDEWHDGGSSTIVLRNQGPIQSVTSVSESWGTVDYTLSEVVLDTGTVGGTFEFSVDLDLGILTRRAAGVATRFAPGRANVHVTFVAGYATTPPDITQKALFVLQRMWETQRGPSARPGQGQVEPGVPSLERLVDELFADYSIPGIA